MNYAIKTPDGSGIFRVILNRPLEDPTKTTPEEAGMWPVDTTIPEGKQQDFSAGEKGWYVDVDTVRPCLMDIPPPGPEPVPFAIPRFKLRLWLNAADLLAVVESMIADPANWPNAKEHTDAMILWNERPDVRRDSVMVNTVGAALGLTQEQIDDAFIAANQLD